MILFGSTLIEKSAFRIINILNNHGSCSSVKVKSPNIAPAESCLLLMGPVCNGVSILNAFIDAAANCNTIHFT
jgi:hypothetical protein